MYGILVLLLLGIAITLIALLSARFGVFEEMLEIVRIAIWPAVVMSALIFFRKAITYLIFSVEELNVFGAKGRLKNVSEVIEDRARELIAREKRELESKQRIEELEGNLRKLKERTKNKDRIAEIAGELIQENTDLWELVRIREQEVAKLKSERIIPDVIETRATDSSLGQHQK